MATLSCGRVDPEAEGEPAGEAGSGAAAAGRSGAGPSQGGSGSGGRGGASANQGGTSATTGGTGGDGGGGNGSAGGAGGVATVPPGCAVDTNGMCVEPPRLIAAIPGCSKLQLLRVADEIYVLSSGTAQLLRFVLTAKPKLEVVAEQLRDPASMAEPSGFTSDGKQAFIVAGRSILRVDLGSGEAQTVTTDPQPISDVTHSDGQLYYASQTLLRTVNASSTGLAGQTLAVAGDEGLPRAIAYTYGHLLWAADASQQVEALPVKSGGDRFKLAPSQGGLLFGPRAMQVDYQYVYWVNFTLQRAPLTKPHFVEAVATGRTDVTAFALDAFPNELATLAHVATASGDIERVALHPLQPRTIARDLGHVTSLAADIGLVYAATADCNVLTLPI